VELEDLEDLVDLAVPAEQRLLLDHLREDAADGPDVDAETVLLLAEEDLGGAVPEGLDLVREGLDGEGEGAGEAEFERGLIRCQTKRGAISRDRLCA